MEMIDFPIAYRCCRLATLSNRPNRKREPDEKGRNGARRLHTKNKIKGKRVSYMAYGNHANVCPIFSPEDNRSIPFPFRAHASHSNRPSTFTISQAITANMLEYQPFKLKTA